MNFTNINKQLDRIQILEEIKKYNKTNQKIAYLNFFVDLLVFYSLLGLAIIICYTINYPFYPSMELIYLLLFMGVFLLAFPYLGITLIICFRTRYNQFVFELIEFIPILIILLYIPFLVINYQSLESLVTIMDTVVILILLTEFSILVKRRFIKKPLFWNDSFAYYVSTILTQQTFAIPEQQDGYSQRPLFRKFDNIKSIFPSSNNFECTMKEYCKFLARKGELIGWTITNEKVILNPRILMSRSNFILGLRSSYKLLVQIYKKHNLTSVNIDYETGEISLSLNYEDYKPLSNVTYHLLAIQLLESFKQSILAFTQQNLEEAYTILVPITKKEIKTFIMKRKVDRPTLLIVPTVVEVLTGSVLLMYTLFTSIILISGYALGLLPTQFPFAFIRGFIVWSLGLFMFSIGLIVLGIGLWRLSLISVIINSIITTLILIYFILTIIVLRIYTISPSADFILIIVLGLILGYFYKNRVYFRFKGNNTLNIILE